MMSNTDRHDPLLQLGEELTIHIFSFVGGKLAKAAPSHPSGSAVAVKEEAEYVEEEVTDEEAEKETKNQKKEEQEEDYLDVIEAGKFYYNLALVSYGWKKLIDSSIYHLATSIVLDCDLSIVKTDSCKKWLCRHKLQISALKTLYRTHFGKYMLGDDVICTIPLLRHCDTSQMKVLHAAFAFRGVNLQQKSYSDRDFLDEVARKCPNLETVDLCLAKPILSSFVSAPFFSLEKLHSLHLGMSCFDPQSMDSGMTLIPQMVQNFPNLQDLFLFSEWDHLAGVMHIHSNSLQQLLVEGFTKHVSMSLDCPNLKCFRCKGFLGPEVLPGQTRQMAMQQKVVQADNVPTSCLGLVYHVCNPQGLPIGFPFHDFVGPHVSLLPVRTRGQAPHHHG